MYWVMGRSGLLSSAAAAVSLMIGSVVVLLAISSMIAFEGWPGADDSVRESRGTAAIARVQTELARARQRVVLGGESPRPATRQTARPRREVRTRPAKKVARVQRVTQAPQPAVKQRPQGEVLGVTVSGGGSAKPDGGAPAPSTAGRDEEPNPLDSIVDSVTGTVDGLIGDSERGVRPVGDLVDALAPNTP